MSLKYELASEPGGGEHLRAAAVADAADLDGQDRYALMNPQP